MFDGPFSYFVIVARLIDQMMQERSMERRREIRSTCVRVCLNEGVTGRSFYATWKFAE